MFVFAFAGSLYIITPDLVSSHFVQFCELNNNNNNNNNNNTKFI